MSSSRAETGIVGHRIIFVLGVSDEATMPMPMTVPVSMSMSTSMVVAVIMFVAMRLSIRMRLACRGADARILLQLLDASRVKRA